MPKTKSANPAYPDADPTAPGGMSQKALVAELVDRHGYDKATATKMRWPEQIDAVVQGRLDREAEQREQVMAEHSGDDMWDLLDEDDAPADLPSNPAPGHVEQAERVMDDIEVQPPVDRPADDFDPEALFGEMRAAQIEAQAEAGDPIPMFIGMPDTHDYVFDGHAGAGPSGAERWMNCTSSLAASRAFLETLSPNQQSRFADANESARQGTTAHAAAETEVNLLMGVLTPEEAEATLMELTIMPDSTGEAYDNEMAEHIAEYVDLIQTYVDAGHQVLVEQRVEAAIPLVGLHEDEVHVIAGSGDAISLPTKADKVLTIIDLKYGDGVDVSVDENPQVRIYGLGALSLLADDEGNLPALNRIDYHIVQPRLGGIKTWSESVEDLVTWRDEVLAPAVTAALYGENNLPEHQPEYSPSEKACQWCPARGGCAALAESRVEGARDLFDAVVEAEFNGHDIAEGFPETGALTNDRLGTLLSQVESLLAIKDDLKEEAQRRLHRGDSIPGYQLVSYTPPRKWKDGALEDIKGNAGLPSLFKPATLLTPTQALKVMGENAEVIADLIDTPDKRPVVAREGDRRKTWEGKPPEQMFPDEVGSDEEVA